MQTKMERRAGLVSKLTTLLQSELAKAGDTLDLSKPDWGWSRATQVP